MRITTKRITKNKTGFLRAVALRREGSGIAYAM